MLNKRALYLSAVFVVSAIVCGLFKDMYGLAYILSIGIGALYIPNFGSYRSYVSKFLASTLVFLATIMLTGLMVWLIGIPVLPLIVIGTNLVLIFLIGKLDKPSSSRNETPFFDKSDIFSLIIASLGPVILIASFSLTPASVFRIASEGWDNGSHVLMVEDASKHNAYIYGPFKELDPILIQKSNAYPQAWHLATANVANGFGIKAFDPKHPIETMYEYVAAIIFWMFIASYVFAKASWYLIQLYSKKRNKLSNIGLIASVSSITILIEMTVIWGAFVSGFSNYIGMIAFLALLISAVIDTEERNKHAKFAIATIAGGASILCWFLPAPAIISIVALHFLSINKLKNWRNLLNVVKQNYLSLSLASIVLLLCVLQVVIFVIFSDTGGSEQLNEGVSVDPNNPVNGVFYVSFVFYILLTIGTLAYWLKQRDFTGLIRDRLLIVMLPLLFIVIGLYGYQMLTSGTISYYMTKLMGVALIPTGVFAAYGFHRWITNDVRLGFKFAYPILPVVAVVVLGSFMIFSNQAAYGAMSLLKQNSRVGEGAAEAVVKHLRTSDPNTSNVIIFRGQEDRKYEDNNGKFETRVVHQDLTCSYRIIKSGYLTEKKLNNLAKCADKLAKKDRVIVVITSGRTRNEIKALNRPNIVIENVKDDK